jgi:hypothetical protein
VPIPEAVPAPLTRNDRGGNTREETEVKVETLVRDSAEVVRIVQLSPGDVYKRLVKQSYETTYSIRLGVVQDVVSNGEQTAVTALEFDYAYSSATPRIEVFANDSDLQLFAATPEEIRTYFAEVFASARRQVQAAEEAATKARGVLQTVDKVSKAIIADELTAPQTSGEITAEPEVPLDETAGADLPAPPW